MRGDEDMGTMRVEGGEEGRGMGSPALCAGLVIWGLCVGG